MTDGEGYESWFRDRFGLVLGAAALTVLVLLLFELPTSQTHTTFQEILVTLLTVVTLVLGLLASGIRRPFLRFGILSAILFVVAVVISAFADFEMVSYLRWFWFVFVVATPFVVLRRLATHRVITANTLYGAASVYLLLAVTFVFLYLGIDIAGDQGFFGDPEPTTSFMYFSLVTITTLGYGDLAPVGDLARAAAVATAVMGQIYLVFIVARMVGIYTSQTVSAGFEEPEEPS